MVLVRYGGYQKIKCKWFCIIKWDMQSCICHFTSFLSAVPYTWLRCGKILGNTSPWAWRILDHQLFTQIRWRHCYFQLDVNQEGLGDYFLFLFLRFSCHRVEFEHLWFCRRGHLFDYTCAVIIYEMCVQEPIATVSNNEIL